MFASGRVGSRHIDHLPPSLPALQAKLALPVKSNASQPASNEPAEAEGFLRELRRISSPSQTTLPSQAT
jgi:hypothetical protein